MQFKKIVSTLTLIGGVMLASHGVVADACGGQAAQAAATPKQPPKFLQFVFSADSATTQSSKGAYHLIMQNVDPSVLYFSNRPRRIVNTMPTGFFIKRWSKPPPHDFKTTPPNAVIVFVDQDKTNKVVMQLMDPIYSADKHSLDFTIKSINADRLPLPSNIPHPTMMMAEVTVCGVLGSWGNLPGEKQSDVECHETANAK